MAVTLLESNGLPSKKFFCVIISRDNDTEELKWEISTHVNKSGYGSPPNPELYLSSQLSFSQHKCFIGINQ